jgi:hypothetical protein
MKANIGIWAAAIMLAGTFGTPATLAASTSRPSSNSPVEVTGCLQQGPAAKEYLLRTSDGTTWGVRESDMLMNDYLDHEVTVAGNLVHSTAAERSGGEVKQVLRAYDVAVEGNTCQK